MKNVTILRILMLSVLTMLFASIASADVYVTGSRNSGSSVTGTANGPSWATYAVLSSQFGNIASSISIDSSSVVTVVYNSNKPAGTYLVGEVWDDEYFLIDYELVYVTLN